MVGKVIAELIRESAAIRVLEETLARGARAVYHDPLMPTLTLAGKTVASVDLEPTSIAALDAVVEHIEYST